MDNQSNLQLSQYLSLARLEAYKYGLKLARERIKKQRDEELGDVINALKQANKQLRAVHEMLITGNADIQQYINAYNATKAIKSKFREESKAFNTEIAAISKLINGIENVLIPYSITMQGLAPKQPSPDEIVMLKSLIQYYRKQGQIQP